MFHLDMSPVWRAFASIDDDHSLEISKFAAPTAAHTLEFFHAGAIAKKTLQYKVSVHVRALSLRR